MGPGPRSGLPAQHREWTDLDRAGQQTVELAEQGLQMWHGQMCIKRRPVHRILVEDEDARIGRIDVEVIVDAARFGPRRGDLCGQKGGQFLAGFRAGGDGADDRVNLSPASGSAQGQG